MMRPTPWCCFVALLVLALPVRAQYSLTELNVAVRSGIDDAEKRQRDRNPAYAQDSTKRARLFFLGSVSAAKSVDRLVRPVNAIAIAHELTRQLEVRGFRAAQKDELPEIVITVVYGRGFLPNPYSDNLADKVVSNLSNSDTMAKWPWHDSVYRLKEKRESAAEEKLVIQVRAWKCPPVPEPGKKPTMLWMTTMHVDDPDHRDLNEIFPQMLASGAPYFDRHVDRQSEVIVSNRLREGNVLIGTPEVVSEPRAK